MTYCSSRSRVFRQASQVGAIQSQCPYQSSLIPKPGVKLTEDKTFVVIVEINKHQIKPAVKQIRDTDMVKLFTFGWREDIRPGEPLHTRKFCFDAISHSSPVTLYDCWSFLMNGTFLIIGRLQNERQTTQ
ncbi:hypothetical protein U0070_007460 [Myodes glareolus]|uniref:Uncharacterized protein n=1 Tax=Myodes glareolus TaxID=447135 RepID=A0AAW0I6R9_MYOGA